MSATPLEAQYCEQPDARESRPDYRKYVYKVLNAVSGPAAENGAPGAFRHLSRKQVGEYQNEEGETIKVYEELVLEKTTSAKELRPPDDDTGAGSVYEVTVEYVYTEPEREDKVIREWVDYTQSTQRRTWAYGDNDVLYMAEGLDLDIGNLVGVTPDNAGGWSADGVDVIVFTGVLCLMMRYSLAQWQMKQEVIGRKQGLCNSDVFRGYQPEELVYLGATIQSQSEGRVEAVHRFMMFPSGEVMLQTPDGARAVTVKGCRAYHDIKRKRANGIGSEVVGAWQGRMYLRTTFVGIL